MKPLLVLVAFLEIGVAAYTLRRLFQGSAAAAVSALRAVMWLLGLFLFYRVGFVFAPSEGVSCKCFGVGSLIGIQDGPLTDLISMLLLAGMLLWGGALLWLTRKWPAMGTATKTSWQSTAKGTRPGPVSVVAAGIVALSTSSLAAQDLTFKPLYTAQGMYTYELFGVDGNGPWEDSQILFEISTDDQGNWQINEKYYGDPRNPSLEPTSFIHSSYDGTNIYSTLHATRFYDGTTLRPVRNAFTGFHHYAEIRRGTFPGISGYSQLFIWLAFMSGDYVKRHPEARIPNVFLYPYRAPLSWACDLDHEWHPRAQSPLWQTGVFRFNHSLLSKDLTRYPDVEEPWNAEELQALQSKIDSYLNIPQPNDLVLGTFSTEEIVNGNGFSFPKRFVGNAYRLNPTNSQLRWRFRRETLVVTNWVAHSNAPAIPLLPKLTGTNVHYNDYRYRFRTKDSHLRYRFYILKDQVWPVSTNDARLAWREGEPRFEERVTTTKRDYLYYITFILIVAFILLPVMLIILKFWRFSAVRVPQRNKEDNNN